MMSDGEAGWTASVFAEDRPKDMEEFRRVRSEPGLVVVDRLADQVRGLREVLPPPGSELLDEPARWVHYPWRRTVVRVLGPHSFRRLRLDRNRNKVTSAEQDRLRGVTVGIVGLSVGFSVAQALVLDGVCGELRLADFDPIELSNLNRVPASLVDLGTNKAVVAARRLSELDPYLSLSVWPDGVGPEAMSEFLDGLDVVVDECDSLDVKVLLRAEAARRAVPVVMETSDRGLIDVERFDLRPGPPFHGLLGEIDPQRLAALSGREKIPYALRLLGPERISTRMAASLLEVERTLVTWPQLGSEVMLGGATVAAVVRRLGLGQPLNSGRGRVDVEACLDALTLPADPGNRAVAEAPLPAESDDPIDRVLHAANRAPSGGNSQPWSITAGGGMLEIDISDDFVPTAIDIHCRGTYVALGAALQNARIAAAAHRILGPVRVLARDRGEPPREVIATMRFSDDTDPVLAAQYEAMLSRGTNRQPGDGTPLSDAETAALYEAAEREGGRIRVVTDADRLAETAELLAESDRIRYLTPVLRREMLAELRWPHSEDIDSGIDVGALGMDDAERTMLDLTVRNDVLDQLGEWDQGHGLGRLTGTRVRSSSALVAVFAEGPRPADYVRAGMAAESVWICAHGMGLAVQPASPVFLYAEDDTDLTRLSEVRFGDLGKLQSTFDDVFDRPTGRRFALLLRVARARPERVRSARRSDRVRRHP
ncbi:POSSIBLE MOLYBDOPTERIN BIOSYNTHESIS PROTEIN MOEY [Rhodococcus aetherivorans]|nr:POSSIBLE MOLYBDOPTERIN BIOSYNTHESIS PROTEIN MOEY [Rhodococcus aetherivorans]